MTAIQVLPRTRAPSGTVLAIASARQPLGIVLVSDNRLLHEGLSALLDRQEDLNVQLTASESHEALERVRAVQPEVVLLDVPPEDPRCVAVASTVRREVPVSRVILMGMKAGHVGVSDLVRSGVDGFVMRDASLETLLGTVRVAATGGCVLPRALTRSMTGERGPLSIATPPEPPFHAAGLTARERDIVELLAEGLCNKAIAARLGISLHTVKSHVHKILEKLALSSRLEIVAYSLARRDAFTVGSSVPRMLARAL
jgi:DNA-binding NarL/FixJ family response regulator